jgi:hypothetical protein
MNELAITCAGQSCRLSFPIADVHLFLKRRQLAQEW